MIGQLDDASVILLDMGPPQNKAIPGVEVSKYFGSTVDLARLDFGLNRDCRRKLMLNIMG